MKAAGKKANACGHPVLLDPVGAGASRLRTETAEELLKEVKFTAIRGNISEDVYKRQVITHRRYNFLHGKCCCGEQKG